MKIGLIIGATVIAMVTVMPARAAQSPQPVIAGYIPLIGVAYDLVRRTDCRGDVLGLKGPGFQPQPKTGNFLIPRVIRRPCKAK